MRDLWIFVFPVALLAAPLLFVAVALGTPVSRRVFELVGVIVAGNLVQLAALIGLWYIEARRRSADRCLDFWGGVLTRYWFIGGVAFYLWWVRDGLRRLADPDAYRRRVWQPFVRSPLAGVVRRVGRFWYPVLILEIVLAALVGIFRLDLLVNAIFGLVGATVTIGLVCASYVQLIVIRDAALRWKGTAEDKSIAENIFSSLYGARAVEAYLKAAQATHSPP